MHLFPTRFFSLSPLRFEILCSPLLYVSAIWMLLSCCCAEALFSCCCFFPLVSLHCKLRKGRKYIHMHLQSSVDMQAFKKTFVRSAWSLVFIYVLYMYRHRSPTVWCCEHFFVFSDQNLALYSRFK